VLIAASLAGALIAAGAVTAAAGACHALPDGTALIVPRTGNGPILGNSSTSSTPPNIGSATFVIPPNMVHTNAGQPLQLPQPPGNPAASTAALSSAAVGRRRARILLDLASSSSSSSGDGGLLLGRMRRVLSSGMLFTYISKPARFGFVIWKCLITGYGVFGRPAVNCLCLQRHARLQRPADDALHSAAIGHMHVCVV
jgi:hypothetical protein